MDRLCNFICRYVSQAIISYGIPRVISAFDNIQAPDDMPRCFFAASTSFHSHWRSYHAS